MIQEVEMTYEEKVEMYMKCTKKELISMLLENQRILKSLTPSYISNPEACSVTVCGMFTYPDGQTAGDCKWCGKPQWMHNTFTT